MKRIFLPLLLFAFGITAIAQWQPLGTQNPFTVPRVVNHKDKAYAIIEGRLCAGDKESDERYAFYQINQTTGIKYACSWGDCFVTATSNTVTVYSDVSIGQVLRSQTLSTGTISSLEVSGSVVLVGVYQGILRSADTLKTLGFSNTTAKDIVDIKALGKHFLAASDSGVQISYNEGLDWLRISNKTSINAVGQLGDTLYAALNNGLYFSLDTGKRWTRVPFFGTNYVNWLSQEDGGLYIYTDDKLFRKSMTGMVEMELGGLAGNYRDVLRLGKSTFVASTWGMVYSEDEKVWTSVIAPVTSTVIRGFTSLATDGNALFAGSMGTGAYMSYDHGMTWTMRSPPFHYGAVWGIYGSYYTDGLWFARTGMSGFRSGDEGRTWQAINNGLEGYASINCFVKANDRLWAGTASGIFSSLDFGTTWQKPDSGIVGEVRRIVSARSGKLLAFGGYTLYESLPPYSAWKAKDLLSTHGFTATAQVGDTLYAGSSGDGVYRSFDGGANWSLLKPGITKGSIGHLVANGEYVVAVDGQGDVFIRSHADTNWTDFKGNLPYAVQGMLIVGDTVYASVQFERLARRSLKDYQSPLGLDMNVPPKKVTHFYPNPASESITFQNLASISLIEVHDVIGNKVLESQPVGQLSVVDLRQGVYVVKTVLKDGTILTDKLIKR